jgi:hypothetical protein
MKKAPHLFIGFILLIISHNSYSQQVQIKRPEIQLNDNLLSISYEILNSSSSDQYSISLDITDESGMKIIARSLSGDIGGEVSGGSKKEIHWDLSSDNIQLKSMLYFQITALLLETGPVASEDEVTFNNNVKESISESIHEAVIPNTEPESTLFAETEIKFSRSNIITQSLLFPGLGLTRITQGKPHWLKGITAYSCVAGTVSFKLGSNNSYDRYLLSKNSLERDDLYNKSLMQNNIATAFLVSATSLWVIDFIRTISRTKDLKTVSKERLSRSLSVQPSFNHVSNSALLTFHCTF